MTGSSNAGWHRRRLFPLILIGSTSVAAITTIAAVSPIQTYDYLSDSHDFTPGQSRSYWQARPDVPFSNIVSQVDKVALSKILSDYDHWNGEASQVSKQFTPQIESNPRVYCPEEASTCALNIPLLRTIEPQYVHGDLRIISVRERTSVINVTVDKKTSVWKTGQIRQQDRNARFILTQSGWVLKTLEEPAKSDQRSVITENEPQSRFRQNDPETLETEIKGSRMKKARINKRRSGFNYYPASASWDDFWKAFPQDEIANDLAKIRRMGGNSIRIFLTHRLFNDPEQSPQMFARLQYFLDMCEQHSIDVLVTTFDLRPDYRVSNWDEDALYLKTLMGHIADHPSVMGIDLKNQADLDFKAFGKSRVTGWVSAMAQTINHVAPDMPVTVGWSDPGEALNMKGHLDFISYHDYQPAAGFGDRLDGVTSQAGDTPVMITEIGVSRWKHPLNANAESDQAHNLAQQLSHVDARIRGVFVWTLNDFNHVGSDVVGVRPWRKRQQQHFGLVDGDGYDRPAAQVYVSFNVKFLSQKETGS